MMPSIGLCPGRRCARHSSPAKVLRALSRRRSAPHRFALWRKRQALTAANKRVFFDLKLLDIDNTVERGVAAIAATGATMLTVHAYPKAMRAAAKAAAGSALSVL